VTDQQAISYLLHENGRLRQLLQACRNERNRQRHRAELWRDRALKRNRRG
jgi:hypothetical protein